MNIIPAKKTVRSWGKKVVLSLLLFTFIAPSLAFAGTEPTPTERWCWGGRDFRDGAAAVTERQCFTTQAICQVDATAAHAGLCQEIWVYGATANPNDLKNNSFAKQADVATLVPSMTSPLAWAAFQTFDKTIGILLKGIAYVIFTVAAFFLQSMAIILDRSIQITINSQMLGNLSFVSIGWTTVRDLSNMFFIFALLYIAIQTILGLAGGGAKRWVANLIIAAILINFSLFFTKVVIDSGNILAVTFWDKMQVTQMGTTAPSGAAKILGGLDLQTLWDKNGGKNAPDFANLSFTDGALVYAGGAIFMFIAGYVILAAALMMITRTIVLAFLMVLSPFAFLSYSIPQMVKYWGQWWDALIKQTFVAPIFLFLLYLNSVLIDSMDLMSMTGTGATLSGATKGEVSSFSIIFNFIMLIGFLLATIGFANKFAGDVGSGARGLARKFTGGVAGATAGGVMYVGSKGMQQTVGRAGQRTAENKKLQNLAANGNWAQRKYANAMIKTGTVMRDSNFDVRNTKVAATAMNKSGLTGIGTKGSQATYGKTGAVAGTRWAGGTIGAESIDKWTKEAEARFPGQPAAQKAYLEDKMGRFYGGAKVAEQGVTAEGLNKGRLGQFGVMGGVALTGDAAKKAKDAAAKIENAKRTDEAKTELKAQPAVYDEKKAKVETLSALKQAGTASQAQLDELKKTEGEMAAAATAIAAALTKLGGKDVAELDEKILKSKIVQKNLNGDHIRGIATYEDSKGYSDRTLLPMIANTAYAEKNTRAINQLNILSKSGQGAAFGIDFKSDIQKARDDFAMLSAADRAKVDPVTGKTEEQKIRERMARSMGYMDPKEITDVDDALLQEDIVAQHLNTTHLKKIVEKQKLSPGNYDDDFFKKLATQIQAGGNDASKKYIEDSKNDNPFFAHKTGTTTATPAPVAQPASPIIIPQTYRTRQTSGVAPAVAAATVAGAVIMTGANARPARAATPPVTPAGTPPTPPAPTSTPPTPPAGGAPAIPTLQNTATIPKPAIPPPPPSGNTTP